MASLQAAESAGAKDLDLEKLILGVLSDAARSGAPAKFSAEQIVGIIALACGPPSDSGLPVSHWMPEELAREARERGLVWSEQGNLCRLWPAQGSAQARRGPTRITA